MSIESALNRVVQQAQAVQSVAPDDYKDPKTGLLMCGKCHTPKQYHFHNAAFDLGLVPVLCDCQRAAREAEQQKRRDAEREMLTARRKAACFGVNDRKAAYTFDTDDRANTAATNAAQGYVRHFTEMREKGRGLFFIGPCGTGKTFLACCIANALLDKGYTVKVSTFADIANRLQGTFDKESIYDDLNAVEAALKLKDELGCKVTVVTMGPPPAEGMLRELLARGADKAVLVSGREFGGSDTFATSQILAAAVNKIGVGPEDVVFCGRQAIDGDTAQVGPQIAEKLHLPQVTYVADIQKDGNTLTVKRMLEDGYMMVKVQTPCLLTCIKELNQPRYMSVNGIFTCYDKPMEVFDYNALKDDPLIEVDTIGLKGSPTNVFKSFTPPQKGAGTMLQGDDVAAQLAGILAKKHLI